MNLIGDLHLLYDDEELMCFDLREAEGDEVHAFIEQVMEVCDTLEEQGYEVFIRASKGDE